MSNPKPWRLLAGAIVGLALGVFLWWFSYDPTAGLFQNPQFVVIPVALGILAVSLRNRSKKAGPYEPETIERNRQGVR